MLQYTSLNKMLSNFSKVLIVHTFFTAVLNNGGIYLFFFSCNLTVHFVKFFKSFTIEGIQNIISILSLFIS